MTNSLNDQFEALGYCLSNFSFVEKAAPVDAPPVHLPARQVRVMQAQPIVAWTPSRLLHAFGVWLMEETKLPHLANPQPVAVRTSTIRLDQTPGI